MFTNIYNALILLSEEDMDIVHPNVQILTGWFKRPQGIIQRVNKLKRKYKYNFK